jgi:hypothetical protein
MIGFDLKAVAKYIRKAETEELLDRVTVYRGGMEPAALDLMEGELDRRGVTREQIAEHDDARRATPLLFHPDGIAVRCRYCERPAVARGWRWWRFAGLLPVLPLRLPVCAEHSGRKPPPGANPPGGDGTAHGRRP